MQLVEKDLPFEEYKQIRIGSDVWIGARAIILDGIQIGHGAVIAAGAVVTKDVPPYAVVAGVPASIIKYRFKPEIQANLLRTKWWENSAENVQKLMGTLVEICHTV